MGEQLTVFKAGDRFVTMANGDAAIWTVGDDGVPVRSDERVRVDTTVVPGVIGTGSAVPLPGS
jgi:hypothetical protein